MNKFMETNKKIEETVVNGYKKIENKFVTSFLTPGGNSLGEESAGDTRSQALERSEDNE
ncbi:MAG: hypothetical protein AAGU12_13875 [Clostridiales bacterium]